MTIELDANAQRRAKLRALAGVQMEEGLHLEGAEGENALDDENEDLALALDELRAGQTEAEQQITLETIDAELAAKIGELPPRVKREAGSLLSTTSCWGKSVRTSRRAGERRGSVRECVHCAP